MLRIEKECRICRAGLHLLKYTLTIILGSSLRDCLVTLYNSILPLECSVSSGLRSISAAHNLSKEILFIGCLGGYFVWGSNSSSYRRQRLLQEVHYLSQISIHHSIPFFGISKEMWTFSNYDQTNFLVLAYNGACMDLACQDFCSPLGTSTIRILTLCESKFLSLKSLKSMESWLTTCSYSPEVNLLNYLQDKKENPPSNCHGPCSTCGSSDFPRTWISDYTSNRKLWVRMPFWYELLYWAA